MPETSFKLRDWRLTPRGNRQGPPDIRQENCPVRGKT